MSINPVTVIDNRPAARSCIHRLTAHEILAIDTESNSLHAYRERVCLIQVSTPDEDFIIDPLRIDLNRDLPEFAVVMADPDIEKVFHAGEYDIICLKRDYGMVFRHIFDTMIGSRILGVDQIGLDKLIDTHFGIQMDKQLQLTNWGRRPLKPEMLLYAQMDTHHLIPLREAIWLELVTRDLWEEAQELFAESTRVEWSKEIFSPNQFWKVKGAHHIAGQEAAILKELFIYRETEAEKRDLPVFKILGDTTLAEIAQTKPASYDELIQIKGMGQKSTEKFGEGILNAINRGLVAPTPERLNHNSRPDESTLCRFEALSEWRKDRARKRGVSSEVIIGKEALWELARVNPLTLEQIAQSGILGPYRLNVYAEDILTILDKVRA